MAAGLDGFTVESTVGTGAGTLAGTLAGIAGEAAAALVDSAGEPISVQNNILIYFRANVEI